jgi:hypothetical protein
MMNHDMWHPEKYTTEGLNLLKLPTHPKGDGINENLKI